MTDLNAPASEAKPAPTRKVGFLLGLGIFLLPIVFAWFTLRKGHSTLSRVVSFIWLVVSIGGASTQLSEPAQAPATAGEPLAEAPARTNDRITMAKYNQLQTGMTYAEAVAILGKPGEEMSSNEIAGTRTVMYQWEGGFGANMNAMFQNDGLVQKAQFGLPD